MSGCGSWRRTLSQARALAATYGAGAGAGLLLTGLRLPLPWLLGPLFATGIASALGRHRPVLRGGRQASQAVVGAALGVYFTRDVLATISGAIPLMVAGGAATLASGLAGARLLCRRGLTAPTAFYASVPGGATEMTVLGERAGGDPAVIALAQTVRVAAVVSGLPFALTFGGVRGTETWSLASRAGSATELVTVAFVGLGLATVAAALRIPNAWLLGTLAGSAFLTASGAASYRLPALVVDAAQVGIGCALGSRFRRELLRDARVLLPSIALGVVQGIVLLSLVAVALSALSGRSLPTLLLATAPGGMAEMSLTARTLQLGVPLVAAFQVMRLAVLLTLAPATFRLWRTVESALAPHQPP